MQDDAATPDDLAPRHKRVLVILGMAALAIASIVLIDRRAMQRMHELEAEQQTAPVEPHEPDFLDLMR